MYLDRSHPHVFLTTELNRQDRMSMCWILAVHPLSVAETFNGSTTQHLAQVADRSDPEMKLSTAAWTGERNALTVGELHVKISVMHVRTNHPLSANRGISVFDRAGGLTTQFD
jgi:hypothetical protein